MNPTPSNSSSGIASNDLATFVALLREGRRKRVGEKQLWQALATVYPHRPSGPGERTLLLAMLQAAADAGHLGLPAAGGRRWDRTMSPAVPISVDLVLVASPAEAFDWRSYPWQEKLAWVPELQRLTGRQVNFLRQVQKGLVEGWFTEPASLKYRSLQLTSGEKELEDIVLSTLFAPGHLTLETLNCTPELLPLAWEPVGEGGRAVVFENAGPFAVARRALSGRRDRPYDLVVYGGGRSVLASLGHLLTIGRPIEALDYVGDLDQAGLEIAAAVRNAARTVGLPEARPAERLHRAMLRAAAELGHPEGWPVGDGRRVAREKAQALVQGIAPDLAERIVSILAGGKRIPEEVLGRGNELACLGQNRS